jgi:hypothetical protein
MMTSARTAVAKAAALAGGAPTEAVALAPAGSAGARKPRSRGGAYGTMRADQERLAELKTKLGDPEYMNGAILRIATVLSARLTLR